MPKNNLIIFHKLSAFVKKDFLIDSSYKFSFFLSWLDTFFQVIIFYFISKFLTVTNSPYLTEYGGQYFPFVFIGLILSGYLTTSLLSFSNNIRNEQMSGTLEVIMATPTKCTTKIIFMSFWSFIANSIKNLVYLLIGFYFFCFDLTKANFFSAAVILVLTIISFSSIGIVSAGFIIIFKKGDPVVWLSNLFSGIFGGVFFLVALLPKNLWIIASFLPMNYALRALRHALLQGYTLNMLLPDIKALLIFCIILLPLSLWVFGCAVKRAKIAGSLGHY